MEMFIKITNINKVNKMETNQLAEFEPLNKLFEEKKQKLLSEVKEVVDTEMKLFEFEIVYSLFVPEEKREETAKLVIKTRKELWERAIKKSKGDIKKAISFYSA